MNPKSKTKAFRNITCTLYPESLPKKWEEILKETGLPAAWILHDQDTWTAEEIAEQIAKGRDMTDVKEGDPKKAHIHLYIHLPGDASPKTIRTFHNLLEPLGLNGEHDIEIVRSHKGMSRYLIHLDNPEKHQYSAAEIRTVNGINLPSLSNLPKLTRDDKIDQRLEIHDIIERKHIRSFAQLVNYCRQLIKEDPIDGRIKYEIVFNQAPSWRAFLQAQEDDRTRRRDVVDAEINHAIIKAQEAAGIDENLTTWEMPTEPPETAEQVESLSAEKDKETDKETDRIQAIEELKSLGIDASKLPEVPNHRQPAVQQTLLYLGGTVTKPDERLSDWWTPDNEPPF